MAEVDNLKLKQGYHPGRYAGNAQLTGSSSTLTVPFKAIVKALVNVRGTNTMTYTISTDTITITGTNDDIIDFDVEGY